MSDEIWLPVVGYEGLYEVSNKGRVLSLTRATGHHAKRSPRILRLKTCRAGYKSAGLWRDGVARYHGVHVLVLTAFHGPKPHRDMECAHNDGSRDNNIPSNLRWDTKTGNLRDKIRHGTVQSGENATGAKLKWRDVVEIRRLAAQGVGPTALAKKFGVAAQTVSAVIERRTWKTPPPQYANAECASMTQKTPWTTKNSPTRRALPSLAPLSPA